MVSKSSQMIMKDRTNKHNSCNTVNNKEKEKVSSSYAMAANDHESNVELIEVDEVVRQHKNDKTNSKFTGK